LLLAVDRLAGGAFDAHKDAAQYDPRWPRLQNPRMAAWRFFMTLKDSRAFLAEFGRSPRAIGAIAPSSRYLAEAMIQPVDFKTAGLIVEFGPGTGAMTDAIRRKLSPQARYIGIELNPRFCAALSSRFPGLVFVNRGAEDIEAILDAGDVGAVDAIICGLPWASLPVSLQAAIMAAIVRVLRPGGIFVTFAYLQGVMLPAAQSLRRRLKTGFARVETTKIIWRNLPPAFAYVCYR
jgi:phospholipid N-methyltransferase